MSIISPGKSQSGLPVTDAEIDAFYGLEPALDLQTPTAVETGSRFVVVQCPYCGEQFETSADASAGMCSYVEDCQVCCQPIEMELRVDDAGQFLELLTRRGDA